MRSSLTVEWFLYCIVTTLHFFRQLPVCPLFTMRSSFVGNSWNDLMIMFRCWHALLMGLTWSFTLNFGLIVQLQQYVQQVPVFNDYFDRSIPYEFQVGENKYLYLTSNDRVCLVQMSLWQMKVVTRTCTWGSIGVKVHWCTLFLIFVHIGRI